MFAAASILAFLALVAPAQASIFTQSDSEMTFYYDVSESSGSEACGSSSSDPVVANWAVTSGINTGVPYCEKSRGYSLDQIGSNNIVAINAATLSGDPAKYCGREVQIYNADGSKFENSGGALYIWDGCAACETADSAILDLSAPTFAELKGGTCSGTNPTGLSYEILDNYVVDPSVGLGSGYSAEGSVDSSSSTDAASASSSSADPIVSISASIGVSVSIGDDTPSSSSAAAPSVTSVRTTRYSSTLFAVSSSSTDAAEESPSSAEASLATAITSASTASVSSSASSSAAQSVASASTSLTSGTDGGCTYGAWQCDGLTLQVCNYQTTTSLGWETIETCGSVCEITDSGSVDCE
ncbi:hypothetical protein B9479_006781 [Cryptococcus floricola]|uniref:Expansin-like EG45 domain-containing protein n=1 Tax=Cryptococcus floricola TaxID=2591691 RepID=A0A5D3AQZ2_9TREE|nr:hypothetical protein B9479_006781 [Cryptococcus floricola]